MNRYCTQQGFNLAELLVVIAIVAVLMVIAAPNFQTYTANQQVRSANDALINSFNLARSEAVTRNAPVTITRDTEWVDGWTIATGGVDLREYDALNGVNIEVLPANTTAITYNPNGRINGGSVISYSVQPQGGVGEQRCVRIGLSGAPASTKGACS